MSSSTCQSIKVEKNQDRKSRKSDREKGFYPLWLAALNSNHHHYSHASSDTWPCPDHQHLYTNMAKLSNFTNFPCAFHFFVWSCFHLFLPNSIIVFFITQIKNNNVCILRINLTKWSIQITKAGLNCKKEKLREKKSILCHFQSENWYARVQHFDKTANINLF